jgi:glycerol kinase
VEHDPAEIVERAKACLEGALDKARAACGPVSVLGLGVTNQRETTVVWCKTTGRALMNAIVWLDTRTRCARPRHAAARTRGTPTRTQR